MCNIVYLFFKTSKHRIFYNWGFSYPFSGGKIMKTMDRIFWKFYVLMCVPVFIALVSLLLFQAPYVVAICWAYASLALIGCCFGVFDTPAVLACLAGFAIVIANFAVAISNYSDAGWFYFLSAIAFTILAGFNAWRAAKAEGIQIWRICCLLAIVMAVDGLGLYYMGQVRVTALLALTFGLLMVGIILVQLLTWQRKKGGIAVAWSLFVSSRVRARWGFLLLGVFFYCFK